MKILLTVSYVIDTDRDRFWNPKSRCLQDDIDRSLQKRFPEKIKLSDSLCGQRYRLSHKAINHHDANLILCPVCKRPLTDPKKPNPIGELDPATELASAPMCTGCAWELKRDVEIHGIAHVMDRFKES